MGGYVCMKGTLTFSEETQGFLLQRVSAERGRYGSNEGYNNARNKS
jgi:hypothetical protein